jgi:hypothetical protein
VPSELSIQCVLERLQSERSWEGLFADEVSRICLYCTVFMNECHSQQCFTGMDAQEPEEHAIPAEEIRAADQPMADEEVLIEDVNMEIEGEEDESEPTPIAVWNELMEQDESVGITQDLLHKIRRCKVPNDGGDTSRRTPGHSKYIIVQIIVVIVGLFPSKR